MNSYTPSLIERANVRPLRPPLRWAGSKQRLLPILRDVAPERFSRYVEPFVGSAALFFFLRPKSATLTDINEDLINFYSVLKMMPVLLHAITSERPVNETEFLEIRRRLQGETCPFERASLFWYLNRSCFNGLFRTNRNGNFNVPFGRKLPAFPDFDQVKCCAEALNAAEVSVNDCRSVIASAGFGDFIYIDPPYARNSDRDRGEYGAGALQDAELPEVIEATLVASERGAKIIFSYNRDLSRQLPQWKQKTVGHLHTMSASTKERRKVDEYIFWNY